MKRLTEYINVAGHEIATIKGINTTTNILSKLAEYEDVEEQGLLLRLPCKPGDIVYVFLARLSVFEFQVVDFVYDSRKRLVMHAEQIGKRGRRYQFFYDDYGKILFFTKEAAEAELIKRQEGEE